MCLSPDVLTLDHIKLPNPTSNAGTDALRPQERLHGAGLAAAPPDVATSSLKFANWFYPRGDSFPGVRVVCLAGETVRGRALWPQGAAELLAVGGGGGGVVGAAGGTGASASGAGSGGTGGGNAGPGGGGASSGGPGSTAAAGGGGAAPGLGPGGCVGARPGRVVQWLAYIDYKAACGRGDVVGDGVTPLQTAQLPGAENVVIRGAW